MLRKLLLPMLATAVLAGCATDYNYRNGNGDYYYGQPRVEYRNVGTNGYYGSFGLGYGSGGYGFESSYYYDPFGRLVYGYPGGYYGSPYYGGNGWYRPRPHRGHGDRDDHDGDDNDGGNGNHSDRPPPWRDLGRLQQRDEDQSGYRNRDDNGDYRQRPIRRPRQESLLEAPPRQQRPAPSAPVIRERSESSSRMGGFIGGAARTQGKRNTPPEE
ncbi:hypothetical protein [Thermomonas sp.]|uniref:hypothetical protein n=1 Tax=Thermomonas sp. TaxID=1971895 RepID=UPI002486F85A|nr:hypothetical protein [Thermomonas sp.]MDI1252312.1 hypothetical protein [Thermomonas sp.]